MFLSKDCTSRIINRTKNFAYDISNIYLKTIKVLFHVILSCAWIHIRKAKLLDHVLVVNDVSINVNLNKILKSILDYKKLGHIRMSLDNLHFFVNMCL